jgi:hypothetical protein
MPKVPRARRKPPRILRLLNRMYRHSVSDSLNEPTASARDENPEWACIARTPFLLPYPRELQHKRARKKVKPHAIPALIGMGMFMAGSMAHPTLANIMVPVAIEQGRADLLGSDLRSLQRNEEDVAPSAATSSLSLNKDAGEGSDSDEGPATPAQQSRSSSPESNERKRLPRRKLPLHGAASTSPSLPIHLKKPRKPRFSDDPLGQLDQDEIPKAATYSSPALSSARQARTSSSLNEQEALLAKYAPQAQRELLRKHFCRSEVGVIVNISSGLDTKPLHTGPVHFDSGEHLQPTAGGTQTGTSQRVAS